MTSQIAKSVEQADDDHRQPTTSTGSTMKKYPTRYTAEIAERILNEVQGGRSLHDVCQDDGIPGSSTVRGWVARNRDGFAVRYNRALEIGRPARNLSPVYTAEIAERILRELADGCTMEAVCRDEGMPAPSTVYLWVSEDREGFTERYFRAREDGRAKLRRATLYTDELAERILHELAEGRTLRDVCRANGMPSPYTVRLWAVEDREGFAARYSRAREFGYHDMADEMLEIADDGRNDWTMRQNKRGNRETVLNHENIKRSRLRYDARRWLLSNALPKIYGNRVEVEAKPAFNPMAEFMKLIDGKTRGLPSEDEPIDEVELDRFVSRFPE
jgi:hypothetical protein